MNVSYTKVGDYLLPNLKIVDKDKNVEIIYKFSIMDQNNNIPITEQLY